MSSLSQQADTPENGTVPRLAHFDFGRSEFDWSIDIPASVTEINTWPSPLRSQKTNIVRLGQLRLEVEARELPN
jgi:hypothetical protein